jgi:thioredoxin 1
LSESILQATDETFQAEVVNAALPGVVDFWAVWCGPCKMIAPLIDEMAREYAGRAVFAKVDVDACPKVATQYAIRSIPTVLFFKGGKVVEQLGAMLGNLRVEMLDPVLCKGLPGEDDLRAVEKLAETIAEKHKQPAKAA